MVTTNDDVIREIEAYIRQDETRMGDVFRLSEEGLKPAEMAVRLGTQHSTFVRYYRHIIHGVVHGDPNGVGKRAGDAAARLRGMLTLDRWSPAARATLECNLERLTGEASPGRGGGQPDQPTEATAVASPALPQADTPQTASRAESLTISCSPDALELLREAAAMQGEEVGVFVLRGSLGRAQSMLAESGMMRLTPADAMQLEQALDEGPSSNPRLAELIRLVRAIQRSSV